MQEDTTTTELDLHEEQLQDVAGGCNDCYWDRRAIATHNSNAQSALSLAAHHAANENWELSQAHYQTAQNHFDQVNAAQARIDARHLPSSSSSSSSSSLSRSSSSGSVTS